MKIVFFGTPEFAAYSLDYLHKQGAHIAAVVTVPDKPAGRGLKVHESEVKIVAKNLGLPLFQPDKLRTDDFLHELQEIKADMFVVVAFRMLPESVWNMPKLGSINLHASLLPQYRGAAPINHAIINGETITGVSTFQLKHEIDTGNILLQKEVAIAESDDAGTLYDKLKREGAVLLHETIRQLTNGTLQAKPQVITPVLKHAPKIFKADCQIDFTKSARQVYDFVRGLSPYPAAYTQLQGIGVKIFKCSYSVDSSGTQRAIETDGKSYLHLRCSDGFISVLELQPEGKKKMAIKDFLNGHSLI